MRKIIILLCCVFLSISLTGCSTPEKNNGMIETSASEVLKKLQRDDNTFMLFLTTSKCYSCDEYKKMIEQTQAETPFDIYYIMIDDENQDKLEELKITIGDFSDLPMTYYFHKGELSADNIKKSYIEPDNFKEWLKQLEMI